VGLVPTGIEGLAPGPCHATGTATPVHDFGFIDFIAASIGGRQARRETDGAVYVDHAAARSTNQMVVVVADPILEASR
jgi:hypothetical protein